MVASSRMLRSVPAAIVVALALFVQNHEQQAEAFTLISPRSHQIVPRFRYANADNVRNPVPISCQHRSASTALQAKPPPSAAFDLASIEALERKLDRAVSSVPQNTNAETSSETGDADEQDCDESSVDNDEVRYFTVPPELHNKRIDAAIAKVDDGLSRSVCGKMVIDGNVALMNDGQATVIDRKSFKVSKGDELRLTIVKTRELSEIVAQELPLSILFEDEHMIVLNKAAGMVVHPAVGNWDGTVVNALAYYLPRSAYGKGDILEAGEPSSSLQTSEKLHDDTDVIDEEDSDNDDDDDEDDDDDDDEEPSFRPGIVHRLDKGTTGILIVAKTTEALAALSASFAGRKVRKTYLAITVGNPGKRVVIDKPIGRHPVHRQKMRVVPDHHKSGSLQSRGRVPMSSRPLPPSQAGRRALSFVDMQAFDSKLALVQVRIETGRTHQIRVHLSDRRTPVYGDEVYGLPDWNKRLMKTHKIERPLLHAWRLEIDHPITGKSLSFQAPLPEDMRRISKAIWPDGESERDDIFAE